MGKDLVEGIVTVATLIVSVGIVAVLVSKNSSTSAVVNAGGSALANAIRAAASPVSGANATSTQIGQSGGIFNSLGQYVGE